MQETAVKLTVQGGFAFGYSAFLNGVFLGSNQGNSTVSMTTDIWSIPNNTLKAGDNVLTVIQGSSRLTVPFPISFFTQTTWGKCLYHLGVTYYESSSKHCGKQQYAFHRLIESRLTCDPSLSQQR